MKELFVAGTETTSSTIEWAMTELLCSSETMSKAVVKETLRLHPSLPFLILHKNQITTPAGSYSDSSISSDRTEGIKQNQEQFFMEQYKGEDINIPEQELNFVVLRVFLAVVLLLQNPRKGQKVFKETASRITGMANSRQFI
ncbi:hypothetical protein FRX31_010660 [Thalictrum thalictroides]|uniref:Cytochrome p450 n=1 Tax=Thalictrum thalictroides TaxID=46969 RepID=A0A7J6WSY5_THATH|nr:hypothetical protein FRX31_010660 [Thalictrum thalictroides]